MEIFSIILTGIIFIFLIFKYKVKGLMYTLILLLPFRFEVFSMNGITIRITDLLALIYVLIWILKLFSSRIKKSYVRQLKIIIFFALFVSIIFFINVLRFNSLDNFIDYIRFVLAVTSGIAIATTANREEIIKLFVVWTISATLSSIVGIFTFFLNGYGFSTIINFDNLNVIEFYKIKFSNSVFFEDPNNLATYLLISIFITLGLIKSNYISNNYKYLVLFIQILGLILTLSRSAYIAIILAFIIKVFLNNKRDFKWVLLKFILIIIIFLGLKYILDIIYSDLSIMSRLGLWKSGINMTLSNPLIGVGIGNSSLLFNQYINTSLLIYNPHFHNLYLTISSELGVIGLVLFLSIFVNHINKWKKYNDKLYTFLLFGLMAYLIQSIGVEYFESRHFWIFLPLIFRYESYLTRGGKSSEPSFGSNACL